VFAYEKRMRREKEVSENEERKNAGKIIELLLGSF
jgi:hypothetical protein